MSGGRSEEIVEAVKLLIDLKKPVDFIAKQLDITPETVRDIISKGRLPQQQRTLFSEPIEPPKKKPETRVASWVQALKK